MAARTLCLPLPLESPQPFFSKSHNLSSLCYSSRTKNCEFLSQNCTLKSSSYPLQSLPTFRKFSDGRPASPLSSSHSTPSITNPADTHLSKALSGVRFLDEKGQEKVKILGKFVHVAEIDGGSLEIRVLKEEELDLAVHLLAESFAESMKAPSSMMGFLRYVVKQSVRERVSLLPHVAVLVAVFRGDDGKEELAGTVEITFDEKGAIDHPPTPVAPKKSPYLCNMTVKKLLRRKGIGWHLLQAAEQLVSTMTTASEVFLHCRMIDSAPLKMYSKAGYNVVKTDSILILLIFQRRKHLMCKKLPAGSDWNTMGAVEVSAA